MNTKVEPNMAETYDEQAEQFADFAPSSFTFVHIERPAYDLHLAPFYQPDTQVLDIGAGAGRMAQLMVSRGILPQNIMGIEISPKLVEIAHKRVPGVRFLCGDARILKTFNRGMFDLITSHMVLEFLDDEGLDVVMEAVFLLLKPGGTFCAITTHPDKMTKSDGVEEIGWFETDAPWGGMVPNWFRRKSDFAKAIQTHLTLENLDDLHVPASSEPSDPERYARVLELDPVRLLIKAVKP